MRLIRECLVIAALIAILLAGCGDDERSFTAAEFVSELNARGLELTLGDPLADDQEEIDAHAITFEDSSGGSLMIAEDSDVAEAEHTRCETAVNILCYRAANVVMLLEESEREAEITAAFRALADE